MAKYTLSSPGSRMKAYGVEGTLQKVKTDAKYWANYYKAAVDIHNTKRKKVATVRPSLQNPALPRNKWIPGAVMVTSAGQVKFKSR